MSMITQRAAEARRLLADETLLAVLSEIQDEAAQVFLNPHSAIEEIARAHEGVRAVATVFAALQSRLDAQAVEDKRKGSAP